MTSKQFFEVFDQIKDDESRITFMKFAKQYGHNYTMESQPDRIIAYFYNNDYSPEIIANTFLECFGEIIICREQIYQRMLNIQPYDAINYEVTLIDCMNDHMRYVPIDHTYDVVNDPDSYRKLFLRIFNLQLALENVGILCATNYPDDFKKLYRLDPKYAEIDNRMLETSNRQRNPFQWILRAN
jgi:hypothetical protein